jgi:hypothetical protein
MLLSMYVFLPFFIGVVGYMLIRAMYEGKFSVIFASLFYFFNLYINLMFPFGTVMLAILLVAFLFYPKMRAWRRCPQCTALFTVLLIDLIFFGMVQVHDFVTQTSTVALDPILLYSLLTDLMTAVLI